MRSSGPRAPGGITCNTGDREFLELALAATRNSLDFFERTEWDAGRKLFRGPACYGDGVAAYPDVYAENGGTSGILEWVGANPDRACKTGAGIPMHALSTNCLYYHAYVLSDRMALELNLPPREKDAAKSAALKSAINRHFWNPVTGCYRYLVDDFGNCEHQEGLGHSFALLFGVADRDQAESVLRRQHRMPAGVPCVWPTFDRYAAFGKNAFGRHSGTVWPHVQGFWAGAALAWDRADLFEYELQRLARHACRDSQFTEIYHPETGLIYGGVQEDLGKGIREWASCRRQSWSATAFLRMVLTGLCGMRFEPGGIRFRPCVPESCNKLRLKGLVYRGMVLDISVTGSGSELAELTVNGRRAETSFLPAAGSGKVCIAIKLAGSHPS